MKRILLISVVFLVSIMPVFAQTVTPKPGAKLHYMNKRAVEEYMLDADVTERPIVRSLSGYKTVEVASSKELKVLGYAASFDDVLYDLYIVLHKGHVAFLNCNDVLDRSGIDRKIESVQKQYYELKNAPEIKNFDVVKRELEQRCQDSLGVAARKIVALNEQIEEKADEFIKTKIEEFESGLEKFESLIAMYKTQYKKAYSTLLVTEASLSGSNSVGGHDVILSYVNMADKTIKYLNWTAKIKNAVGDYVSCSTRHISTFKGKETGPVYYDEEGGGTWENVIYDWSARELEMQTISIIYMDGSTTSLSHKEIKASLAYANVLETGEKLEGALSELRNPYSDTCTKIRKEYKQDFEEQTNALYDDVARWKKRIDALEKKSPDAFTAVEKLDPILSVYNEAYMKAADARQSVRRFEKSMGLKGTYIF